MATSKKVSGDVIPADGLTRREQQVLQRMADGLTAEQIATELRLTPRTVRTYSQMLKLKLGARNACHAVNLGHLTGYLGRPQ